MQATETELQGLLELQEADRAAINAENRLAALPQRAELDALAKKKHAVLEKLAQVTKMHDATRRKRSQIEDERAILLRKQQETQEKIDAASGDFRAVQSLTRDLDGIAKRLNTLEGELAAATEKHEAVSSVKRQAEDAIAAFDAQALKIRESFQRDAAALREEQEAARARRTNIAQGIGADILKAYAEAARRGGGMGMARLVENRCSTCRNTIDANRLLQVKREAPLARCPNCGRLLIVC